MAVIYVDTQRLRARQPAVRVCWDDGTTTHHYRVAIDGPSKIVHEPDGFADRRKTVAIFAADADVRPADGQPDE